jgi:hypothetical protein
MIQECDSNGERDILETQEAAAVATGTGKCIFDEIENIAAIRDGDNGSWILCIR